MDKALRIDEAPDVLNVSEAARLLRVGRSSIYDRIREGDFPAIRIGRRLVISKAALLRLIEGQGDWTSSIRKDE